ncbi:UDP-N-acetylglucosamine transferase subunit, putative [Candida dubliniensis CD36]|uniref:UDP-N-acetylglucosamine transferase subunit ALG14 n=1 Tax=Candida dubliniensis (strain CD36 / ATCC MYA-646 / CBS 7987 / NCPF 3949 / NRRL Y-17841) TaxID=573826 RepID=B9WCW3_CANDC|nr:UDP-N-acetylglucosamine transferase subunit, putative [Candida dubliniensis CD36]CAX44238.1 UDP-N-acetylglucosamine transferase subunit, putative [Candida dubliniensis CD36]
MTLHVETAACFSIALIAAPILIVLIRLLFILPALRLPTSIKKKRKLIEECQISFLLGSGGHTGEMMRIVSKLDMEKVSRTWIYSSGDSSSLAKAQEYEKKSGTTSHYISIPRARTVGQSYISSIPTTLYSFLFSAIVLLKHRPAVILLNGPGTCVPVAYILFFYKLLGLCNTKIIYIESLARVNKLSLSGLLVLPISDRFIVQWESLYQQYNRVEYYGILI